MSSLLTLERVPPLPVDEVPSWLRALVTPGGCSSSQIFFRIVLPRPPALAPLEGIRGDVQCDIMLGLQED